MNTPILKATKPNKTLNFYNNGEYEKWKEENEDGKGYKIKYYKGLGTSTSKEFKEYFQEKELYVLNDKKASRKRLTIYSTNQKRTTEKILETYDRNKYLDTNVSEISYDDFINNELIHFSKYDCDRSIPNMVDGLKVSQRKILYSAFKKKLYQEIKVAQFSGYVSEHSGISPR